jgi:hypothetical protein
VGNRSFKNGLAKGALVLAAGAFLVAAAVPAIAAGLGGNGSSTTGVPTGNFLSTWYDIGSPVGRNTITPSPNFGKPGGDNVLSLVAPNGCGNSGTANTICESETDVCAMIYVFDDSQEMGECCGCPLTPNELRTFSVRDALVSNWALGTQANSRGTIVVIGSSINDPGTGATMNGCGNGNNFTCNDGCNPTVAPITAGVTNLDGSITHDQLVAGRNNLTETKLYDQGAGEPTNNTYLPQQCGAIAGNSSNRNGFCSCGFLPRG